MRNKLLLMGIGFALLSASAIFAQTTTYDEATSPYYDSEISELGYGGLTGVLDDDVLNPNGIFTFEVFHPAGVGVVIGQSFFQFPPAYYGGVLESTSIANPCISEGTADRCTVTWTAQEYFDDSSVMPEGVMRIYVTDRDSFVDEVPVYYTAGPGAPTPYLPVNLIGNVASPVAEFENVDAETITDPAVKTKQISLLVRDPVGIDRVELNLGGDIVTISDGVSVPESDTVGSDTQRFTYDWDVEALDTGNFSVSGTAYSTDGRSRSVFSQLGSSAINVTLAVDVNQKLQQQCQENLAAVQALTTEVATSEIARANRLKEIADDALDYIDDQENVSQDTLDLVQALSENLTAIDQTNDQLEDSSEVSCNVSLGEDVNNFRDNYEAHATLTLLISDNIVNVINSYLEGQTNG